MYAAAAAASVSAAAAAAAEKIVFFDYSCTLHACMHVGARCSNQVFEGLFSYYNIIKEGIVIKLNFTERQFSIDCCLLKPVGFYIHERVR